MHYFPLLRACLLALFATGVALLPAAAIAQTHHTGQHRFNDAEKWAKRFDDPQRDAWQKPREVIDALKLAPDTVIADIGSGTGYFAVRFAQAVPQGRVLGVDTEPGMVKYLNARAQREGLKNIQSINATPGDARLPEKADLIILVDVYHHIDKREAYFKQLQASLKPGGRLAVIDFRLDSPEGPPVSARIAPERVKKELAGAGYALTQEHAFLPNQYFLIFQPGN